MIGAQTTRRALSQTLLICVATATFVMLSQEPTRAVVVIFDGFGDADRNNDGAITSYDTDLTEAEDPNDIGIVWSGIRSFDTAANIPKSDLKIIDDDVPIGSETASEIHNHGLALGVDSRGNGSSFMGRFGQSIDVGPIAGDKVVVSVDFRIWRESSNPTDPDPDFNELRWGVFEDTDNELGSSANFGEGGASVVWGRDDGNWYASQPGAEGDKGIYSRIPFGGLASPFDSRINWEYNLANINGTANNGRIFEGSGVSNTPGAGGDTGTVALPPNDGDGGIISDTFVPHKLSMEIIRLADGLIQVASFIDNVEILRDEIKTTDTGYNVIGPPAFSYDYVAFRNASGDFDYVIDNFMVEIFGSNEGLDGDFNNDGSVDAADYVVWRKTDGTTDGYNLWRQNFGASLGSGSGALASTGAVPEPASLALLLIGGWLITGTRRRNG